MRAAGGRVPAGERRPSRSCPTSAGASWPPPPGCGCAPATTRSRASATCSTPASREPPSAVVLSYRSSDEEGNLALPSPFIADVAELLEPDWPERRRRRLLADVVWPPGRGPDRARAGPHRGGGVRAAGRRAPGAGAIAVADRAAPRPPQRDPVRRRARGLRRLPDEVAGRARAPARADRARTRPAWSAGATCTTCSSR